MMEKLPPLEPTVVCVLRSGEFQGRRYTLEWVHRLKAMVARNLSVPHRFVCFTDIAPFPNVDIGVELFPLNHDWPGWWSKIELFRWNAGCRLLYFDLDVLITGPIDDLLSFPAPMALMPAIVTRPKEKCVRLYQSSVMVWTPPEGREIFSKFLPHPAHRMDMFRGDQDWIGYIKPNCATFPAKWFAKLTQLKGRQPPKNIKVVLCQHPLSNDLAAGRYEWVREIWRGQATREGELAKSRVS